MLKKSFFFFLFFLLTFVCIGCFGDGGPLGVSVRSDSVNTGFGSYNKATKKISVGFGRDARVLLGSENKSFLKNELGLDWYYTWNWERAKFMGSDPSVEFVPMMGNLVDYEKRINIVKKKQPLPNFILMANEPWHHVPVEDHEPVIINMLDTLERLVKEFPDSNVVKIGTPGIAWGPRGLSGLSNFMRAVNGDPDKYRIDIGVFHSYGINYNYFKSNINIMRGIAKYQGRDLKLWLTEFGAPYNGWKTNVYDPDELKAVADKTITNFLREVLYQFNTNNQLERYSWWSYPMKLDLERYPSLEHLRLITNKNGGRTLSLTPLGKAYAKYSKNPPMTRPTLAEIQPGGRYGPDL